MHVVIFSLTGAIFSLTGGLLLIQKRSWTESLMRIAPPFAAGSLLGAVFFDLLSEAFEVSTLDTILYSVLAGIVVFFCLERATHWFHHHHEEDRAFRHTKSPLLIIFGDTFHNALDGIVIGSAFLVSVPAGIVTAIAVAAHEIPQEIGDFGVLLGKGMRAKKVALVNLISASASLITAVFTFLLGDADKLPLGVMLGLSAGFLLYVAMSDLIPTIHAKSHRWKSIDLNIVYFLAGLSLVGAAVTLAHRYIVEPDHGSSTSEVNTRHEE